MAKAIAREARFPRLAGPSWCVASCSSPSESRACSCCLGRCRRGVQRHRRFALPGASRPVGTMSPSWPSSLRRDRGRAHPRLGGR
jgi:hypothetical protein